MTRVTTPQSRLRTAAARCDITPPVGIYHRMWGAAMHDRATGVHRPLTATLLWLEPHAGGPAHILVSVDHCILDHDEIVRMSAAIAQASGALADNIHLTLTHTHGAGLMSRGRRSFPGGEMIGPYLDEVTKRLSLSAATLRDRATSATIVYGTGRCPLAAHRDLFDRERGHAVCGFNPTGPADDTVIVGRIAALDGTPIATIVNYACHPTTLAWDNTLISPDWVGAMRETVEAAAGGLCLFLQGASGDLGPVEGFVGDPAIADRNGRQLGYAVLSTLESMHPPGTDFVYAGPVVSGTRIGTWKHQPASAAALEQQATWKWTTDIVNLPYRHDLPTTDETTRSREHWQREEELARQQGDTLRVRDCRAKVEQMTRQLGRLSVLPAGRAYPLRVSIARLGDALWVLVPGELYQVFQTTLRERFAPRPVIVATLTGDWQPGYIPPASIFGYGIYQEVIAATSPGSLELLIEAVTRALRSGETP